MRLPLPSAVQMTLVLSLAMRSVSVFSSLFFIYLFFIYFHLSCSLFLILDNFQLLLDQKLQNDTCDIQTQIFFWKWIQRGKYN